MKILKIKRNKLKMLTYQTGFRYIYPDIEGLVHTYTDYNNTAFYSKRVDKENGFTAEEFGLNPDGDGIGGTYNGEGGCYFVRMDGRVGFQTYSDYYDIGCGTLVTHRLIGPLAEVHIID